MLSKLLDRSFAFSKSCGDKYRYESAHVESGGQFRALEDAFRTANNTVDQTSHFASFPVCFVSLIVLCALQARLTVICHTATRKRSSIRQRPAGVDDQIVAALSFS